MGKVSLDRDVLARGLSEAMRLPVDDPDRLWVERLAESLARDGKRRRAQARRAEQRRQDEAVTAASATGAPGRREDAPLPTPGQVAESVGTLRRPRRCYICKGFYYKVSAFYHHLCMKCSAENLASRTARTPLHGRNALITGGRVKIGFQLALMLLRDGAAVRITTRFPHDAVQRFRAVADSGDWLHRLTVTGVDLRDPRQVVELCDEMTDSGRHLDILVNNAAQTVRRPAASYAVLIAAEQRAADLLGGREVREIAGIRGFPGPRVAINATDLPSLPSAGAFERPGVDEAGLLPDTAPHNSWTAVLGELDPVEMLEVQLVNAVAPTLLADRLLPLMLASPNPRRYIVNATAVEGRFEVRNKTARHPHTNMAKAALNMLTRTSAGDLAQRGVYLCSADTGWITDEKPTPRKEVHAATGFRTPLDVVDGAARLYHPIIRGEAGEPLYGVFLKDYRAAAW
jgi:NAD(P)-dependent dehydrogenase (short-subunit alcohol dehydrogenase family)